MYYLILCRNNSLGSWFLRACMWSPWSHSAVYDEEEDLVYDTTFWQGGVKAHTLQDFSDHYPHAELRECPVTDIDAARGWLRAQLGKPYDWTALLSFIVHRAWQDDDSWFCSEMSETFRSLFSLPKFRADASRITPYHQDIVA